MREDWDNLRTVLQLVRHGSLAGAAKALGVSYTTVSRRVAAAEESFGTPLFERLQAGYAPTEAGRSAARHAEQMEQAELALRRELAARDTALTGPLVITAPQLLIASHLCHVIDAFLEKHPGVELTIRATNELLDLNNREADLAIRISDTPGDDLVGRRLARQHTASFASPDYASKLQDNPGDMIDWLGFTFWQDPPKAAMALNPNQRVRMRFDDMSALIGAAQAGLGVARMPMFVGRAAGGLMQVPILPPQQYHDIWVLSHRDLKDAAKLRAFKDMLVPYFAAHKDDFVGVS
ncbi:LysR family transcriptional regulator [Actibacterium lipolyticum]|nr:LysR family transcriptional regulator [Actibacterium lipolyticum]